MPRSYVGCIAALAAVMAMAGVALASSPITIGYSTGWLLDEAQVAIQAGLVETAAAHGDRVVTVNANGDVKRQLDQIDDLIAMLNSDGVLIYETFMIGNEKLGRPSNPDFLLEPGELLERVRGRLTVVAFEQGRVEQPKPSFVQRICARAGNVDVLPS